MTKELEGVYRRATDEEKEEANVCEEYELLIGPDGFECVLTDPEDRNFYRDGVPIITELNRLYALVSRYKRGLADIRDKWTDIGIIKERAQSALGTEPETAMHTNGGEK
jgi:hypothetical protein